MKVSAVSRQLFLARLFRYFFFFFFIYIFAFVARIWCPGRLKIALRTDFFHGTINPFLPHFESLAQGFPVNLGGGSLAGGALSECPVGPLTCVGQAFALSYSDWSWLPAPASILLLGLICRYSNTVTLESQMPPNYNHPESSLQQSK